jgi:hypothetical protein
MGPGSGTDGRQCPDAAVDDDRNSHRRADADGTHPCGDRPGNVLVAVYPRGEASAVHHRCEGDALDRRAGTYRPLAKRCRFGGGGHERNLVACVETPYSGGERTQAPAHFLGHSADHFRRFGAARDQRAQAPHGRLLLNEPPIFGVQRDISEMLVELPSKGWFVGG